MFNYSDIKRQANILPEDPFLSIWPYTLSEALPEFRNSSEPGRYFAKLSSASQFSNSEIQKLQESRTTPKYEKGRQV